MAEAATNKRLNEDLAAIDILEKKNPNVTRNLNIASRAKTSVRFYDVRKPVMVAEYDHLMIFR